MPKIPDVVDGETIETTWGNQSIRDRTVQRMDNTADRDASIPSPQPGETVYLTDDSRLEIWTGSEWSQFFASIGGSVHIQKTMYIGSGFTTFNVAAASSSFTNTIEAKAVKSTGEIEAGEFQHRNIWIDRTPSTPVGIVKGDLWIDSISKTLQMWDGSAWVLLLQGV